MCRQNRARTATQGDVCFRVGFEAKFFCLRLIHLHYINTVKLTPVYGGVGAPQGTPALRFVFIQVSGVGEV